MLAGCRWFNAGIFDKANADVSMLDQTKGDLRKLFVFFNVDPPKILDTQAKTWTLEFTTCLFVVIVSIVYGANGWFKFNGVYRQVDEIVELWQHL